MNLILFGIQGSGKGTQAKLLADEFGYKLFQPGAILRQTAQEDTDLGRKIKSIMESGSLVSTELIMEMLREFLEKNKTEKIIFDGVPRKQEQENQMSKVLAEFNLTATALHITLTEDKVMERLLKRIEIEGRPDDNTEAIKARLSIFKEETIPVIQHYQKTNNLIKVEGDQSIEEVYQDIVKAIQS